MSKKAHIYAFNLKVHLTEWIDWVLLNYLQTVYLYEASGRSMLRSFLLILPKICCLKRCRPAAIESRGHLT